MRNRDLLIFALITACVVVAAVHSYMNWVDSNKIYTAEGKVVEVTRVRPGDEVLVIIENQDGRFSLFCEDLVMDPPIGEYIRVTYKIDHHNTRHDTLKIKSIQVVG